MSFAPMHYRKQPIYEDGDYSQLSIYVRGLGEMIRKFCNDQGVLALGGRSPAEAVAHRMGALRGDRRSLAGDIDILVRSGFLRLEQNAIVVVQQEEFWSELNTTRSSRSTREPNATRTSPARDANATSTRPEHDQSTTGTLTEHYRHTNGALSEHYQHTKDDPSAGKHSQDTVASDNRIGDKSEEINKKNPSPTGEGVQGEHDLKQTTQEPKAPEPFALAPVAPEAPKAKSKAKPKAPEPEQRVITLLPTEQLAVDAIRNDPDLVRICKNVEQLAVDLVNCAPLVDVALEIRGLGAYLRTDKGRKKRYTDGNGYLLNNIGRKQAEQSERQASMPHYAQSTMPQEPKRKVPLAPLPSAITLEGAARAKARMERGESWMPDFSKVGWKLPPLPPDDPEMIAMLKAADEADKAAGNA